MTGLGGATQWCRPASRLIDKRLMMKNYIYAVVLLLSIGFSSSAFAAKWVVIGGYKDSNSAYAACLVVAKSFHGYACWGSPTNVTDAPLVGVYDTMQFFTDPDAVTHIAGYNKAGGCPGGGVPDDNGRCPDCRSGASSTAGYYVPGYWSVGSSESDHVQVGTYTEPSTLCDGKCEGTVKNIVVGSCAASSSSGGTVSSPVPIHCDYDLTLDGKTCQGGNGDAPVWNGNTDKLCSNGASDYPTCTPPTCANGAKDYPTCTPPTCSNGASDYPTCTPPKCANGATDYPGCTQTGSDPGGTGGTGGTGGNTGGTGGNTGGTGSGGTGTGSGTTKIDESGVPPVVGLDGTGNINSVGDERIKGFGDQTKITDLPWHLNFTLPGGACQPIGWSVFGQPHTIDICPMLEKVRAALAYLWYGLATIYIWKRATSATGGGA